MSLEIQTFQQRISEIRNIHVQVLYDGPEGGSYKERLLLVTSILDRGRILLVDNKAEYQKILKKLSPSLHCNVFLTESISLCPIDNILVPEHKLVDLDRLKNMYCNMEYPRILFTDPIAKWNGWYCNSLIEVHRTDGPYYRLLECSGCVICKNEMFIQDLSDE